MHAADLIIGLMSGTSLDGVDAVLVDFSAAQPKPIASSYLPYPAALRQDVLDLHRPQHDEIHRAELVSCQLARAYADTVHKLLAETNTPVSTIAAIGCHGQTIRHQPQAGYSKQLNNPALLAELTGITVIADFRNRDIAAGGQGAPLVPAFHATVFRHPTIHRAILNLGGIANLTNLPPQDKTSGFDCGPGNMLLDAWVQKHLSQVYDHDGQWAASGKVLPDLLAQLLAHEFLKASPPKSSGREQFNLDWLSHFLHAEMQANDVQATLLAYTTHAVAQAIHNWCGPVEELYVCGGGAYNTTLLKQLQEILPKIRVQTTDSLGLAANWVEAVAFAWLAYRTLTQHSGNLPEVTGARGPRILGGIYLA